MVDIEQLLHNVLAETICGYSFEFGLGANTLKEHGWFFNYKGISEVRHITHLYARSLEKDYASVIAKAPLHSYTGQCTYCGKRQGTVLKETGDGSLSLFEKTFNFSSRPVISDS